MWFVPSQADGGGGYLVNLLAVTCTCADYELRAVVTALPVDEAGADPTKMICQSWAEK